MERERQESEPEASVGRAKVDLSARKADYDEPEPEIVLAEGLQNEQPSEGLGEAAGPSAAVSSTCQRLPPQQKAIRVRQLKDSTEKTEADSSLRALLGSRRFFLSFVVISVLCWLCYLFTSVGTGQGASVPGRDGPLLGKTYLLVGSPISISFRDDHHANLVDGAGHEKAVWWSFYGEDADALKACLGATKHEYWLRARGNQLQLEDNTAYAEVDAQRANILDSMRTAVQSIMQGTAPEKVQYKNAVHGKLEPLTIQIRQELATRRRPGTVVFDPRSYQITGHDADGLELPLRISLDGHTWFWTSPHVTLPEDERRLMNSGGSPIFLGQDIPPDGVDSIVVSTIAHDVSPDGLSLFTTIPESVYRKNGWYQTSGFRMRRAGAPFAFYLSLLMAALYFWQAHRTNKPVNRFLWLTAISLSAAFGLALAPYTCFVFYGIAIFLILAGFYYFLVQGPGLIGPERIYLNRSYYPQTVRDLPYEPKPNTEDDGL